MKILNWLTQQLVGSPFPWMKLQVSQCTFQGLHLQCKTSSSNLTLSKKPVMRQEQSNVTCTTQTSNLQKSGDFWERNNIPKTLTYKCQENVSA